MHTLCERRLETFYCSEFGRRREKICAKAFFALKRAFLELELGTEVVVKLQREGKKSWVLAL
jgi:hypothetical protein